MYMGVLFVEVTVNREIVASNFYCDFVILNSNAISLFAILRKILFNSYKKLQNASLNYCDYNPISFFAMIKTSQ